MASEPNKHISALQQALTLSPDNLPLRLLLAQTLLDAGQLQDAANQFRMCIASDPSNDAKLGLAAACLQLGDASQSIVILESLLENSAPNAAPINMLLAKALLATGDAASARNAYHAGLRADPTTEDPSLTRRLGALPIEVTPADGRPFDMTDDDIEDDAIRIFADEEPLGDPVVELDKPEIDFDSVGGMASVKKEIQLKIIHPLQHPEIYEAYGKKIGGGILMYGPPGCGKTHLARATAGEVQAKFIAVGINDVLNMYLGNSERNLHEIFQQARRNTPCVLFFDEVDALGASRTDMQRSAGRQMINQFLSELDGVKESNDGVLILAATNAPWHIDPAFRRPGRFDRIIFVPPPDLPARAEIGRIMLSGKPTTKIDLEAIAKKTSDFSGADLKAMVDVAIEGKLEQAMSTGIPEPLTTRDLLKAAKALKPTTREWFTTARNYAMYANESGLYDEILDYMKLR